MTFNSVPRPPNSRSSLRRFGSLIRRKSENLSDWWNARQNNDLGSDIPQQQLFDALDERLFVDPTKLENELHTRQRAIEDGRNVYPPPQAVLYDKFHQDLILRIEQLQAEQTSNRIDLLQKIVADLNSVRLDKPDEVLKNIFYRTVKSDIRNIFTESEPKLMAKRIDLGVASRSYSYFRAMNNRVSEAERRSKSGRVLSTLALVVMMLFEFWVNHESLAYSNDQGDLGPLMIASSICLVNLLIPLGLGWTAGRGIHLMTFKNNRHRRSKWAIVWGLVLVAGIFGMVTLNALFAQLRAAIIQYTDIATAFKEGIPAFRTNPFSWLSDPMADFMFLAGLLMAFVAYYEGAIAFSDIYPGYSDITKKRDRAWESYTREQQNLYESIRALFEDAKQELFDVVDENRRHFQYFHNRMREFQKLRERHEQQMAALEATINMIANRYREDNVAHRGGAPVPAYFNERLLINRDYGFWTIDVDERYASISREMQALEDAANQYAEQLTLTEEHEQARLQRILDSIEGKAIERINHFAPVLTETQARIFEF